MVLPGIAIPYYAGRDSVDEAHRRADGAAQGGAGQAAPDPHLDRWADPDRQRSRQLSPPPRDEREPVYAIAVAARLTGMHPQTLRKYERAGLLRPARQSGNQRLYSDRDIRRLNRLRFLVESRGLNLAGLEMTLTIVDRLERVEGQAS
jgi:hypothetical protein